MELTTLEELYKFLKTGKFDFSNRQFLSSKRPSSCENDECIMGVDEAGRGPVLGPMVYCVSYVPKKRMGDLEALGCADSKTLTEKKREDLFTILCSCNEYVGWAVDVISPNFISQSMLKRVKCSLNEIAQEATVSLIKSVMTQKVNITEIYVDTVGPPEKYQKRLSTIFPECRVTVTKKADSIYPIVSAASICAKVIRDATIGNWKFTENLSYDTDSIGSGYPNDPKTKAFLKENVDKVFGFPQLVRFSWSTASKVLDESCCPIEWDDEEGESSLATGKDTIRAFFNSSNLKEEPKMKHRFFRERNLVRAKFF